MTEDEEKKAREDRAKADAEAGTKLDKILSHLDSFGARMDALEAKEKERCDAEQARKDAEAEGARKLAGEEGSEVAADKKRKDAEAAEKKDEDKAKADAEKAEEEKIKADAARKDSAGLGEIKAEIEKLRASTPRFGTDAGHATYADAQARADSVYQMFGRQAPPAMLAQDLNAYRLRLARELQPYSDIWKNANLGLVAADSAAFEAAESEIYEAAKRAAMSPANLTDGQERVMTRVDRETGRKTVEFARKDSFVRDHGTPPQYVTRFNTEPASAN